MTADIRMWLADPLPPEAAQLIHRLAQALDARRVAVLPDVHAAIDVCIGVALGTSSLIYPHAVGSDIGCGMSTLRFTGPAPDARARANILRRLQRKVRVLTRGPGLALPPPDLLSDEALRKAALRDGAREIGTLGRGNHFIELQADEEGAVWALVHSGSRAMGQVITTHHLRRSTPGALPSLEAGLPAGAAYLADAAWACDFARASRRAMLDDVASALRGFDLTPEPHTLIDSCHNMVRLEEHDGVLLLVHRKGAASARAEQVIAVLRH